MKPGLGLALKSPGPARAPLRFPSLVKGLEHLCDHLLTPPEMHAWSWLFPPVREVSESDRRRFRLGKSLWKHLETEGKDYLSFWLQKLEQTMAQASRLGWVFRDGDKTLFFDFNGILLVVGKGGILVSAYIPLPSVPLLPLSTGEETQDRNQTIESRIKTPFPREGRRKLQRKGTGKKKKKKEDQEEIPIWRPSAPEEESLVRFRIFRRASGEVRSRLIRALSLGRRKEREALALFREARSNLETWLEVFREEAKGEAGLR